MTTYNVIATKDVVNTELSGYCLLPVSRTDGKKGKSGICIQVPVLSESVMHLVMNDAKGREFIVDCIDGIRSKIASALHKSGKTIADDAIGITAILAAMSEATASVRFSKEGIATWFNDELLPLLAAAVESKLIGISTDKLKRITDGYLGDFQLLAAREVMISAELKLKLEKAMLLLPDDYEHHVAEKIAAKLQAAGTKVVEDVL
jgi:hypothetical protein